MKYAILVVAILAGWFTTEIGRQPWIVYNVMRTADAVSPHGAVELGVTLALFVVVYFAVFGAGLVYMLRLIAAGPAPPASGRSAKPSAARASSWRRRRWKSSTRSPRKRARKSSRRRAMPCSTSPPSTPSSSSGRRARG